MYNPRTAVSNWRACSPSMRLAAAARRRESELLGLIYGHHPRFAGTKCLYGPELEQVAGGDVLLLAPSVIAVGVGGRTTPAGAERLARRVFDAGLAHTVLAVPLAKKRAQMHLDAVCAMVDTDAVVMSANIVDTLSAFTIARTADSVTPFLTARAATISLVVFCAVYAFIFAFGTYYIYRLLRAGPGGFLVEPPKAAVPNRPMSAIDDKYAADLRHHVAGE